MRIYAPLNSESVPILQEVEVATFFQLPSFHIIGLPGPEVAEAKERVKSAIEASGLEFPRRRVVINLSPAHIRKRGTGLDSAMALAILLQDRADLSGKLGSWGELGLDGTLKPVGQITRTLYAAWNGGLAYLVIAACEYEQALKAVQRIRQSGEVQGDPPEIIPVHTLSEIWTLLQKEKDLWKKENTAKPFSLSPSPTEPKNEFSLLPISPALERILGVAAAGHHHLLILGPRGTGKSHALEWLIALQPETSPQDLLKQNLVAELAQQSFSKNAIRRVSSQVKPASLLGGATAAAIRPGEVSLAHGGILVADEFPEWSRDSREALREPLERGRVSITRANGAVELPAQFILAANGNLCPCGGWPKQGTAARPELNSTASRCKCADPVRRAYLNRLSGPLLDRMDLTVLLTQLLIPQSSKNTTSRLHALQNKVNEVRASLIQKWGMPSGLLSGARSEEVIEDFGNSNDIAELAPSFSLRSRHKILKVALSLAAWDGLALPQETHFAEAACFRSERFLFID